MSNDVSKLPKWAQREIERLEQALAYAQAKLAARPEDSNTFADSYSDKRPLETDPSIRFQMDDYGEQRGHQQYVECRIDRDASGASFLYVRGGDSIAVEPTSSNVVRVRLA